MPSWREFYLWAEENGYRKVIDLKELRTSFGHNVVMIKCAPNQFCAYQMRIEDTTDLSGGVIGVVGKGLPLKIDETSDDTCNPMPQILISQGAIDEQRVYISNGRIKAQDI
jgi:hypothetical protein